MIGFCCFLVAAESVDETAIGDEGEVWAVGVKAFVDFGESFLEIAFCLAFLVKNEAGTCAADEPAGAQAGVFEFVFDMGKDFCGLARSECGVDPLVENDNGVSPLP